MGHNSKSGEKFMSYLRVNLAKTDSKQGRDEILERINNSADTMFPDIEMMLGIATGETSIMTVSIYADEEIATKAIGQRNEHMKNNKTELEVAFEGELKAFFKKEIITVNPSMG